MWNFRKLEIDNLMSFGQATIEFVDGEVVVIYGINKDAGVEKSNGSGKSALLEGFGFGVTGSPLREVKIGELVNDDVKHANVSVTLDNIGLNEVMQINRVAYKSKSSVCQILINGELVENLTSTDEANKFIENKLGVVREDLLNFFVLTAAKFTPFLDASDTKKKEIINRFSNGIIVDESISLLEEDKQLCSEELRDIDAVNNQYIGTLEALGSTLLDVEGVSDEADNTSERIEGYKADIQKIIENLTEDQRESLLLVSDREEIDVEISQLPNPDELESQLRELGVLASTKNGEIGRLKTKLQETDHQINHLRLKIEGSIECPKCAHDFDPTDDDFDMEVAEKDLHQLRLDRTCIVEDGKGVRKEVDECSAKIELKQAKISKMTGVKNALHNERSLIAEDIAKINRSNESNNDKIEAHEMKIDALSSNKSKDVITPLKNKISSVKAKLEPVAVKLGELTEELDDYNVQLDVFRRFKSHLANMSLKSMEGLVNNYLDSFGSDIFLQLNSDSKLANGKTKEKISSTLIRNGVDIGSFNKRSGGEKAAINLAFAKTLSHLINLNAGENKGVNLLIIDEILDSTDQEGMQKIVCAMENNGETAIIITHIPLSGNLGKTITVVKENDISKIEQV